MKKELYSLRSGDGTRSLMYREGGNIWHLTGEPSELGSSRYNSLGLKAHIPDRPMQIHGANLRKGDIIVMTGSGRPQVALVHGQAPGGNSFTVRYILSDRPDNFYSYNNRGYFSILASGAEPLETPVVQGPEWNWKTSKTGSMHYRGWALEYEVVLHSRPKYYSVALRDIVRGSCVRTSTSTMDDAVAFIETFARGLRASN